MKKLLCMAALLLLTGCGSHVIPLSAAAAASKHSVLLTWHAPGGDDPAISYNVYRELESGAPGFRQINTSPVPGVTYRDTAVQPGASYAYVVRAVDASGNESAPSNTAVVTIPSQ